MVTVNSHMMSKLHHPTTRRIYDGQYRTDLIESLIIFGGFFLIKTSRFNELGRFDDQLKIWAWWMSVNILALIKSRKLRVSSCLDVVLWLNRKL